VDETLDADEGHDIVADDAAGQEEFERPGKLGVPGRLGGEPGVTAYTRQGKLDGKLVARRELNALLTQLQQARARRESIDRVLRRLSPPPARGWRAV
jgi:hypothetical protein